MHMNSYELLASLLESDPRAKAEWVLERKLKNDPRITEVGKFIRRTSIDELPQLWNVLKGDMSLVGPRPIPDDELEKYGSQKNYYVLSRPGITGLWQISGRNDISYETRANLDAWYIRNWSLWCDITILVKTVRIVVSGAGAY